MAVVGLGAIGLELGQALTRFGVEVTGFDTCSSIAGIADPEINEVAVQTLRRDFPLHLGVAAEVKSDAFGV